MINSLKNFFISCLIYFVPLLSIIGVVLILYIPRSNEFWNFLRTAPLYTGIYFWSTTRSDIFNLLSAFFLGIMADIIGSTPLGVNIITFLTLYTLSIKLSDYFNIQKFFYAWILYTVILLITFIFKTILICTFYRQIIPLHFLAFEFFLNIMIYPLTIRLFAKIERRFIHLEERYEKI